MKPDEIAAVRERLSVTAHHGIRSTLTPDEALGVLGHLDHQAREIERLQGALEDMLSGWLYIRKHHGDLYGVGWERAQTKAEQALGGGS